MTNTRRIELSLSRPFHARWILGATLIPMAIACGSDNSGPAQAGLGLGGATSAGGALPAGTVGGATGGATVGSSSGGATVAAGGTTAIGAGGTSIVTPGTGGTTSTGAGGNASGGASTAADAGPSGPMPYRLTIAIPSAAPGEEGTNCVQNRLPNSAELSVNKLHNTMTVGSHHFIVSTIAAANAPEMPLTPCTAFQAAIQGGPLAITQKRDDVIRTPTGVGYSLAPNQVVNLELHYINTSSDPVHIEATTEIYPAEDGAKLQPSTVLLIGTLSFSIPPMGTASTGPRYIQMPSVLDGVNYFAITGHTHRLGTAVTVSSAASGTATPTPLYAPTPFEWDSPELKPLTPAVQVPTGGGFVLQCDWKNTTNGIVGFGESATQEMCFFWAYYYPKKMVSNLILEGFGPVGLGALGPAGM